VNENGIPERPVGAFLQADTAAGRQAAEPPCGTLTPKGPASAPAVAPHGGLEMQTLKAFVVEDSPIILDNLVATLEELAPVEVVGSAADESGALTWLNENASGCDLVIIDIFLRTGSGLGVLRRAAEIGLKGKRVVLTNYATTDMRQKCAALGADRVFDKSNELDELIAYCMRLSEDGDEQDEIASLH
jgi:CheY-like chemotaxis protein